MGRCQTSRCLSLAEIIRNYRESSTPLSFDTDKVLKLQKSQMEIIARNTFMAQEDRDPTGCSLIFFALGKKKVVHGLWKQAPGHKEQNMMLKFLGNDFTQDRWKTAALKNAYALLSKNRYGKPHNMQ